jgi:uncharacterized protein with GYD domain
LFISKGKERETAMNTYITLIHFTQVGVEKIKDSPKRLEDVKKAFKAAGAEMKAFYLVMGQYDAVVISEAPNDETVAKVGLAIGSKGYVRTETLRAFTEDEYRKIVSALP